MPQKGDIVGAALTTKTHVNIYFEKKIAKPST